MENYFNLKSLLVFFNKWKKTYITIIVLGTLAGIIISHPLILHPKFKTTVTLYPSNLKSYSDESETEQLLQFLNSEDLLDSLIIHFDLINHYGFNGYSKENKFYTRKELESNLEISKTEYESIKIEILDEDTLTSFNMMNDLIDLANNKILLEHKMKFKEGLDIAELQLLKKSLEVDSLSNILQVLRTEYGVLNYNSQAEQLYRNYYNTSSNASIIKESLINLKTKGGIFNQTNTLLNSAIEDYVGLKRHYEKLKEYYETQKTYFTIVSSPKLALKKSYPIRWIIVLSFSISSFMLAFILTSISEFIQNNKS